jgi:hypothetical protein
MNENLSESLQYLKQCISLENETFRLYQTVSQKINQPETSSTLGLAYDSLKNAKVIEGILNYFDQTENENKNGKKYLSELSTEIMELTKKISKINNLDYLVACEVLRDSLKLEGLLAEVYKNYLESSAPNTIVNGLSKLVTVNLSNFKKVFEEFTEEKGRHREIIIEIIYALEEKETETHRQITPVVKYQNPDAWNRESTLNSFPSVTA